MKEPTTLLVDADIVAFQFSATAQETYKWDEETTSTHVEPLEEVTPLVDTFLAELKEKLRADDIIICLSCSHEENWRLGVLPSYKGNRDYDNRPVHLDPIKDYLAEHYRSYSRPTLEADDVMGILSTHPTLIPGRKIIVSEDKDMKTIPGWLFNPRKHSAPVLVPEHEADYWHLYQALTGDSTDHYKGCPGIGPVKAERALTCLDGDAYLTAPEMWRAVVGLYESKGLTEADALVQARVARICRSGDWDFKNKQVILWNPLGKKD